MPCYFLWYVFYFLYRFKFFILYYFIIVKIIPTKNIIMTKKWQKNDTKKIWKPVFNITHNTQNTQNTQNTNLMERCSNHCCTTEPNCNNIQIISQLFFLNSVLIDFAVFWISSSRMRDTAYRYHATNLKYTRVHNFQWSLNGENIRHCVVVYVFVVVCSCVICCICVSMVVRQ